METLTCPFCGGNVILKRITDLYSDNKNKYHVYVCENFFTGKCDAYIKATKIGDKYIPMGTLANAKLRAKRIELSEELFKIWKHKVINSINPDFIVRYNLPDKIGFAKRIEDKKDFIIIEDLFTKERYELPKTNTTTVPLRTKTYLTLSLEMGIPMEVCTPNYLNYEEVLSALNIVHKWWHKIIKK